MKLERSLFALLLSGLLVACAEPTDSAQAPFGWRSAGLELPDADNTGGLHSMVNIGNRLFAMDAYSPKNAPASRPYQWRIWMGTAGTNAWRQLPMPHGEIPDTWIVIGAKLIVGAKYSTHVYRYDPSSNAWDSLPGLAEPIAPDTLPRIGGLGVLNGRLAVTRSMNVTANHGCYLQDLGSFQIEQIPCMGKRKRTTWDYSATIGDTLYGVSEQFGVYRYHLGDSLWDSLPLVVEETNPNLQNLSSVAAIDGKIYVGTRGWWDGLYRWDGDHWTSMTPTPGNGTRMRETPKSIFTIASYRGRMFIAGDEGGSTVMHTPKDSSKIQFGDWSIVDDNWCKILNGCPLRAGGLLGVGDTLYATGWSFVAKVPLSDLDKMARPLYPNYTP